jgi:hypothetical protein
LQVHAKLLSRCPKPIPLGYQAPSELLHDLQSAAGDASRVKEVLQRLADLVQLYLGLARKVRAELVDSTTAPVLRKKGSRHDHAAGEYRAFSATVVVYFDQSLTANQLHAILVHEMTHHYLYFWLFRRIRG